MVGWEPCTFTFKVTTVGPIFKLHTLIIGFINYLHARFEANLRWLMIYNRMTYRGC